MIKPKKRCHFLHRLSHRQVVTKSFRNVLSVEDFPLSMGQQIDSDHDGIFQLMHHLRLYISTSVDNEASSSSSGSSSRRNFHSILQDLHKRITLGHRRNRESALHFGCPDLLVHYLLKCPDSLETNVLIEICMILRECCMSSVDVCTTLSALDDLLLFLFSTLKRSSSVRRTNSQISSFESVCALAEELLATRHLPFDLRLIDEDLESFLTPFGPRQLAVFSRILALLCFDPEDRRLMEQGTVLRSIELLNRRVDRMSNMPRAEANGKSTSKSLNLVDQNHVVLISVPTFVPRMVQLLRMASSSFTAHQSFERLMSREPSPSSGHVDHLEDEEEDTMSSTTMEMFSLFLQSLHSFSRPNSVQDDWEEEEEDVGDDTQSHHIRRFKALALVPHQIEVMFTICTLLAGTHKLELQRLLIEDLKILPILVKMFDQLDWSLSLASLASRDNGRPSSQSSPQQIALRIQYLRLLHHLFDHHYLFKDTTTNDDTDDTDGRSLEQISHQHKLLLLNAREQDLLLHNDNKRLKINVHQDAEQNGLLCNIIHVVITTTLHHYRFWLISTIEVFLRGPGTMAAHQLFVARTPLLRFLIRDILQQGSGVHPNNADNPILRLLNTMSHQNNQNHRRKEDLDRHHSSNHLQTNFDLLGELLKDNEVVLEIFVETLRAETHEWLEFMRIMVTHLTDSNVFIRSMFYLIEKHDVHQQLFSSSSSTLTKESTTTSVWHDPVIQFFHENVFEILKNLMTIVTLEDINHETICCLNTAITMYIFAHRRNQLAQVLTRVEDRCSKTNDASFDKVCRNFRRLLWFWHEYYDLWTSRRDRVSLETSSHIAFTEWTVVIALLCQDTRSSTCLTSLVSTCPVLPQLVPFASSDFHTQPHQHQPQQHYRIQ